jgi:nitroreductase
VDCIEAVKGRRSIRRYKALDVSEESLRQVLEALRWSPSGGNIQPWEVIVVKDHATKLKLQETLGRANPARKSLVQAPVVLVLCGKVEIPDTYRGESKTKFGNWWFMFHLGSAAQNLCLAAYHLNLGTLMVGFFDHDRVKELLLVPDGYEVVLLIPIGYPERDPSAPQRRTIDEFLHYERF